MFKVIILYKNGQAVVTTADSDQMAQQVKRAFTGDDVHNIYIEAVE